MLQVEKLSYGFPEKDLYRDISFTIEEGRHCALIGSNGTGKSTLVDLLIHPDRRWFDGRIQMDEACRIGYAGQFRVQDKTQGCTVFAYLSKRFTDLAQAIAEVCEKMADPQNDEAAMEQLLARYQALLDQSEAMDADHYESAVRRQLNLAGMGELEETQLSEVSGGEYKLLQIMREMLLAPNFLVLDEPDVFLDFENLNGLVKLINGYKGTLLAVTHNRYLLNHCFDKVLHLENGELQEFDGTYGAYRCAVLREKIKQRQQHILEQEEIARTEQMVEVLRKRATLMVNPTIGQAVNAKQSQLDRLLARQIKAPFIEVREPQITLPQIKAAGDAPQAVLQVSDYEVKFEEQLLQNVNFEVRAGEKTALIGPNGTGKTTLIRDILKNETPAIRINPDTSYACLSQSEGKTAAETQTVFDVLLDAGFKNKEEMRSCLAAYTLPPDALEQKVSLLSGGEQNLLQLAVLSRSEAELLILDEPTSHLDLYAQAALEKAIDQYHGTIFMVTHDFYLAADCADYILLIENNTVRRIRSRSFRKMVYDRYFDSAYLEIDRKKQELETAVTAALQRDDPEAADRYCTELEKISEAARKTQK